jgi:hypothetical protein
MSVPPFLASFLELTKLKHEVKRLRLNLFFDVIIPDDVQVIFYHGEEPKRFVGIRFYLLADIVESPHGSEGESHVARSDLTRSRWCDNETMDGGHFTMEDILIRPDVVFEKYLTMAREGTPYCQDNLISLLAENEGFNRFLQPSDERWVHQRMLEQEKEADERKAEQDDLPF